MIVSEKIALGRAYGYLPEESGSIKDEGSITSTCPIPSETK